MFFRCYIMHNESITKNNKKTKRKRIQMPKKKNRLEIRIVIEDEKEIALIEQKRDAISKNTGLKKMMIDKQIYIRSISTSENFITTK